MDGISIIDPEVKDAMWQLVVDLDVAEDQRLPIESLENDTPRVAAALLLAQSGEVSIDLENPDNIHLTQKGRWLRQGIFVVAGE